MIARLFAVLIVATCAATALADSGGNRFSIGAGIITLNNPSQTDVEVSGEFEYRETQYTGWGGMISYIFASPSGITLLGVPEGFLHPLGGDWIIYGMPLLEFGSNIGNHLGVRFGTRFPLPTGSPITLIPEIAVDYINGGSDVLVALGIAF